MKKKLLSLLLVLSMMLGMVAVMPITIGAADTITITSVDDWMDMLSGKTATNKNIVVTADVLDFAGKTVVPVKDFSGTFDGQGVVIKNLTIIGDSSTGNEAGLFNCCAGASTFKNFVMTDSTIQGTQWVGAVACCTSGNTVAENIYISDTVTVKAGAKDSNSYAGGLFGGYAGSVTECRISDCVFAGTVTSEGKYNGGLVGAMHNCPSLIIENSMVLGKVTNTIDNSCGFIGNANKKTVTMTNCIYAGGAEDVYYYNRPFFYSATTANMSNCYTIAANSNGKVYNDTVHGGDSGVTLLDSIKPIYGYPTIDIEGYTVRNLDVIVPDGVAGFDLPNTRYYDTIVWDGEAADGFGGGSGSAADPYLITNESEWEFFAQSCYNGTTYSGKYIKLMANLVFNKGDASTWAASSPANSVTPAGQDGDVTNPFSGNFDGNGKTISGVYMKVSTHWGGGLFGCTKNATISNFKLTNSAFVFEAKGWSAAVAGENYNKLTVSNVYVDASVYVTASGCGAIGGVVGGLEADSDVTVDNCVFAGTITGSTGETGGIIGSGNSNKLHVTNCLFIGSVSGATNVSGIVGGTGASGSSIENCISVGTATNAIAAKCKDQTTVYIKNCWYMGEKAHLTGSKEKPATENLVKLDSLKEVIGASASVTIEGWTKRDGDVMVPNGVASFDLPQWYVAPVLSGEGTSTTPYLIADASEWLTFVDMAKEKDFAGQYVVLESDIDFKNVTVAPVEGFAGTFDGKFYTIKNLTMSGSGDIGLFCSLGNNATVKNFVIKSSSYTVKNGNWIGAVACCTNGKNVTISGIYVDRDVTINAGKKDGNSIAGGILGGVYGTNSAVVTVDNCAFAGTITATGDNVGGIVGSAEKDLEINKDNTLIVTNCMNMGSVTSSTNLVAGIAVGQTATIENCVNIGKVAGAKYVGGIYAGNPKSDITVTNCYSYGSIEGHNTAGGGTITVTDCVATSSLGAMVGNSATVPATFAKRAGDFAVPAALDAYIPTLLTMQMYNGAAVRFDNPTGIRFTAILSAEYLNSLKGDKEATFGIIIAPTDYVEEADAFTVDALDALDYEYAYVTIPAELIYSGGEDMGYYEFRGTLGGIHDYNYDREFSAIAYVEVDGEYYYSAYNAEDNSRSIAYVAQKAYEDTNYEKTSAYPNEIADQAGVYSPYTSAQREILLAFFGKSDALDLHFLSYNIRNVEGGYDNFSFQEDYKVHYEYTDREKYVINYLVNYGADIIGLQEVSWKKAVSANSQLDWFDTLGDEDTVAGLTAAGYTCVKGADIYAEGYSPRKTMYNPIYFKTDTFNLIASGDKWLSSTPDVPSTIDGANTYKNLHYVVLEHKETGVRFVYVNLHLIVQGDNNFVHNGNGEDTEFKVQQLQVIYLRSILQDLQDQYDLPMFVGGDFNNTYNTINDWFKKSVVGENEWDISNGTPEETVKLSIARDQAVSKTPSLRSCPQGEAFDVKAVNGNAIDLWFTSNLGDSVVHVYQIIDNMTTTSTGEKYPSDHLPAKLYVTLYID